MLPKSPANFRGSPFGWKDGAATNAWIDGLGTFGAETGLTGAEYVSTGLDANDGIKKAGAEVLGFHVEGLDAVAAGVEVGADIRIY